MVKTRGCRDGKKIKDGQLLVKWEDPLILLLKSREAPCAGEYIRKYLTREAAAYFFNFFSETDEILSDTEVISIE
jgi:hypothetical protein